jgi:hypothetical protein
MAHGITLQSFAVVVLHRHFDLRLSQRGRQKSEPLLKMSPAGPVDHTRPQLHRDRASIEANKRSDRRPYRHGRAKFRLR